MKKNLIALAVAAAVAAPAAMADTTLYGLAHVSYDFYQGTEENYNHGLSSNSSRLGVKGSEKISDGLTAIYQFETTVNVDDGSSLWGSARNTFVGMTGGWGTALFGRHDTPMKLVSRKYDLFGDQVGDSRNLTGVKDGGAGFDLRPGNVAAYVSPKMAGFQAILAYVADHDLAPEDTKGTINVGKDYNKNNAYSLSAGYEIAGFTVDGAYEQHRVNKDMLGTSSASESMWRLGAGYKFSGFNVVGLVQQSKDVGFTSGNKRTVWGLGGGYTFGANTVKVQYYAAQKLKTDKGDVADSDGGMVAVGYDYKLSKQTTVYAAYAHTMNKDGSTFVPWGGGHEDQPALKKEAGKDGGVFSVGVKHAF